MGDTQPVFMRLPTSVAQELDRMTRDTGASKRDVVTRLILGEGLAVGQHEFRPGPDPSVLTAEQTAELLQVSLELVVALASAGELPGRCLGGEWRFSRAAVLQWLSSGERSESAQ